MPTEPGGVPPSEPILAEWESRAAVPAYYTIAGDPPPVGTLSRGIYLVRGGKQTAGYLPLPDLVTLEAKLPAKPPPGMRQDVEIRSTAGQIRSLGGAEFLAERMASEVVWDNRLTATLPRDNALFLMKDWALNLLSGARGVRVGIACRELTPLGFVGVTAGEGGEILDLIGVGRRFTARGVGLALVNWALGASTAKVVRVRTEGNNPAALRLYAACGFTEKSRLSQAWVKVS